MSTSRGLRARHWCFTFFPDTGRELFLKDNKKVKYVIVGDEVCPTTGREHKQGYVYFKRDVSLNVAQKALTNYKMNMRICRGDELQNRNYCSKDGKVEEYGERPRAGARNDIHSTNDYLEQGLPLKDIIAKSTSYQAARMAELKYKYLEKKRVLEELEVIWIYGGTARERKKTAFCIDEDAFTPISDKWWEGYDGEETVLITEWDNKYCTQKRLEQLTDIFPFRVETKGGSRQVQYTRIVFTSKNYPSVDNEIQERLDIRCIDEQRAEVEGNTDLDYSDAESEIQRYINRHKYRDGSENEFSDHRSCGSCASSVISVEEWEG